MKYLIIGRKWFDKRYGNTYHSVEITDLESGEVIVPNDTYEYGYGEAWMQTAYNKLVKMDLVKAEDRNNHALNKTRFVKRSFEVTRKRDLT